MWLLDTNRAELKYFPSSKDVDKEGGYAILSHVWEQAGEQTFQDLQKLYKESISTGTNPRDRASPKIRECCILAEKHGYKWLWVDTCCIDKTSSTELSEAINSMFQYYSLAEVCYAYLADVPTGDVLDASSACAISFCDSKWHERGWTLQELLAPTCVVFLSLDWDVLGGKAELAGLLEKITRIPTRVLSMEDDLSTISVGGRMSWASHRKTTREEDLAYSLMGIFSINMPTLYGEGQQAFRRLQEEIMKLSIDTTLFAWGDRSYWPNIVHHPYHPLTMFHTHQSWGSYLFAEVPANFSSGQDLSFTPPSGWDHRTTTVLNREGPSESASRIAGSNQPTPYQVGTPTFNITPYGVRARIPMLYLSGFPVAVLFCTAGAQRAGLFLTPCSDIPADHSCPAYHTGVVHQFTRGIVRIAPLGSVLDDRDSGKNNLVFRIAGKLVTAEWREIYIMHRSPPRSSRTSLTSLNSRINAPFRFSESSLRGFLSSCAYRLADANVDPAWTGSPAVALIFEDAGYQGARFVLQLGLCDSEESGTNATTIGEAADSERRRRLGPHWANIQFYGAWSPVEPPTHDCPVDHICEWANGVRVYADNVSKRPNRILRDTVQFPNVVLSFAPFSLNPSRTLVVRMTSYERS